MSEQFCTVGDVELCYETFGDPTDPPLLLVMGLGTQMIAWREDFCRLLVDRGLLRDPLRQPRHRALDAPARRAAADRPPDAHARPAGGRVHARRPRRRRRRPARLPRHRGRARRRRLDGRDDRPDARRAAPGQGADADVDHVDDRPPPVGPAGAARLPLLPREARRPTRTRRSSASSSSSASSARPASSATRTTCARWPSRVLRPRRGRRRRHGPPAPGGPRLGQPDAGAAAASRRRRSSSTARPTSSSRRRGGRATARAIPGARLVLFKGMGHDLPAPALAALRRPHRRARVAGPARRAARAAAA